MGQAAQVDVPQGGEHLEAGDPKPLGAQKLGRGLQEASQVLLGKLIDEMPFLIAQKGVEEPHHGRVAD